MAFEEDTPEELMQHKIIAVTYAAVMSDDELVKFAEYVKRGGKLVIVGDFAIYDVDGSLRDKKTVAKLMGTEVVPGSFVKLGAGEIQYVDYEVTQDMYQPTLWAWNRIDNESVEAVPSKWDEQKNGIGAILKNIVGTPRVEVVCENNRVLATAYAVDNALAINVINLADTISETKKLVQHTDVVTNFAEDAPKLPEIILKVCVGEGRKAEQIVLKTPEREKEIALDFEISGNNLQIKIPEGIFSGYALIVVE